MHNMMLDTLWDATLQTLYMVFLSSLIATVLGVLLGIFLFLTAKDQILEHHLLNHVMSFMVNVTRSIPFIILMIALLPLTRILVGSSIGIHAAIVPLVFSATPFYARICESALFEIPQGLIETAHALGATTYQLVTKFLLPESLPTLIRGATLTIISLIGYSAMAGAVGGGGLGELAINYGYQRFNVVVMLETIVVLVVIVQMVQWFGDYLAKHRTVRPVVSVGVLFFVLIGVSIYSFSPTHQGSLLRVGIVNGPMKDIMTVAQSEAKKRYDLNLKIVTFEDYVLPNTALEDKSIDVNLFQHEPYLAIQMKARHYHLAAIAKTFLYPMGFYSKKIKSLNELKAGDIVALPNDPSNQARALRLLESAHLIRLQVASTLPSVRNVAHNLQRLQFKLLDAAQLSRVFSDATLVALTNDFIALSGLSLKQAIIKEGIDSPYANVIVARQSDYHSKKQRELLKQFVAVMHSQAVIKKTYELFPGGGAVSAW